MSIWNFVLLSLTPLCFGLSHITHSVRPTQMLSSPWNLKGPTRWAIDFLFSISITLLFLAVFAYFWIDGILCSSVHILVWALNSFRGAWCVILIFPGIQPYVAALNNLTFIYSKGDRPHKLHAQSDTCSLHRTSWTWPTPCHTLSCQIFHMLIDTSAAYCCLSYLFSALQVCFICCLFETSAVSPPQLLYCGREARVLQRDQQMGYSLHSASP